MTKVKKELLKNMDIDAELELYRRLKRSFKSKLEKIRELAGAYNPIFKRKYMKVARSRRKASSPKLIIFDNE